MIRTSLAALLLSSAPALAGVVIETPQKSEEQSLTSGTPTGGAELGGAAAIDGDLAVAGARFDDQVATGTGSAHVFERVGGVWSETAKLIASDAANSDFFGRSVAASAGTILVGAPFDDDDGSNSGAVYVFEKVAGVWTEVQKLTASDAATFDQFGTAVALDGDRALIGASGESDVQSFSGAAYVFERVGGLWVEVQRLKASDAGNGDGFGFAVSLRGDVACIGTSSDDGVGVNSGSAYVFERSAGAFAQTTKLIASDEAAGDFFGFSTAVAESSVLVGAPRNGDAGADTGAVYAFEKIAGTWQETQKILSSNFAAGQRFGDALAADGPLAAVGARGTSVGGSGDAGAVVVLERANGAWSEVLRGVASAPSGGDRLGSGVAVSGPVVVAGAPREDTASSNAGAVLVFDRRIVPVGDGCIGSSGSAPTLRVSGHPDVPDPLVVAVDGGPSDGVGLLFAGFGSQTTVLEGGCEFLVDLATLRVAPIALNGVGATSFSAALPASAVDTEVTAQVVLDDPGAPGGISATNAAAISID